MRGKLRDASLALAASALLIGAAPADVVVSRPVLRLIPGVPAAGYFELANRTNKPIVLTGALSADCGMVMMHKSSTAGGMARMADVPSVSVAPGGHASFAPGGYHLMCMSPSTRLHVGSNATITLTFGDGRRLDVSFAVVNARGH